MLSPAIDQRGPGATVGASGTVVMANRRFLDDVRKLPLAVRAEVSKRIRQIREFGPRYPELEAHKIRGNPTGRFWLMDVDQAHRMVVARADGMVFLEKVGEIGPTEEWGLRATLDEYEEHMAVDQPTLDRQHRRAANSSRTHSWISASSSRKSWHRVR